MIHLSEYRKLELQQLAEAISLEYHPNGIFRPDTVAADNKISHSFGNYENAFDGLLEHRFGKFHIYLNIDRVPDTEHPRMRFTFAHELAHYFIDEHRNSLKNGKVPSHPSFNSLIAKNVVEREADYFASCLLLPSVKVRNYCHRKPLSSKLIDDLSNHFRTSTSSVVFRYLELSLFPMMVIMTKLGIIEWKIATPDFKYKYLVSKLNKVPPTTAAGEYFLKGTRYRTEEIVFAEDWYSDYYRIKDEQFYEKCYYLPGDKVMSVIWKKEKK
jgi:Zn-dependent peptidase ImmA (M78 family)